MRTNVLVIIAVSSILMLGCRSSAINNDATKIDHLNKLISDRSYEINADWAFPLMTQGLTSLADSGLFMPGSNANRIDLMGNFNFLKVIGDSVAVSLPYFGERRMGGGYGTIDNGINFSGIPNKYSVEWDEKKNRYQIKMEVIQKTETLEFNISVFPSLKADINVNSTHRTSISFTGDLKSISGD